MSMKNASQDNSAHPTKDAPSCPERDGRKTAHNDSSTVTQNNPPTDNRNNADSGSPAKFLQWLHPETPLNEDTLSQKWTYWHPRDIDDEREPRKDSYPTWDGDGE